MFTNKFNQGERQGEWKPQYSGERNLKNSIEKKFLCIHGLKDSVLLNDHTMQSSSQIQWNSHQIHNGIFSE